ncbi:MAG TPA: chemotaxis protein CheX [Acidobacteriaceae bacterium]|jgi:chemotaxis protein CheX|nr:chemotaxis protein CheX [Acidobacteriaceae bacterium]
MIAVAARAEEAGRREAQLDRAVHEVFSAMMAVDCLPVDDSVVPERETISAVIGLAGALSGSMVLHGGICAAISMTERLTGMAPDGLNAMVCDAVGEVCNMIAGAWKGVDPLLASGCLLSTPTVVAGSSYELFSQRAPLRMERSYRFADCLFGITLFCESCA